MIKKYSDKNKYGGFTWELSLHSLFKLQIHETETEALVVEFSEWKWLSSKVLFAFVSNEDLGQTICKSYDRIFEMFKDHQDFSWTEYQKEEKKKQTIRELNLMLNL